MFIDKVVTKIWEPVNEIYYAAYEEAMQWDDIVIYEKVLSRKMKYYPYVGVNMNYIDTLGCPYRMRGGKLSGCSMCDYQSENAIYQGWMLALRTKNPHLYASVVRIGFENARGKKAQGNVIENVSGYDSLDKEEVPDELCTEIFTKDLFGSSPFIYNVEARATSITEERLIEFKKSIKKKKRVSIDFGVEVGNEWLRNEWLNKSVNNKDIINAITLLHQHGFRAIGNVLLGVPGLTERQIINTFISSVLWLDQSGIDKIVIHVLNRKKYSLQGYIYEKLRDNVRLHEIGLVQGEHTGLPWLYTIVIALTEVYTINPNIFEKMVMVRIDKQFNSIDNDVSYNVNPQDEDEINLVEYLNSLAINKNYESLLHKREEIMKEKKYLEYMKLLELQKKCININDSLQIMSEEIAKSMWGNQWEAYMNELKIPDNLQI